MPEEDTDKLRLQILVKLSAAPYRFSSKAIADSTRYKWSEVDRELGKMLAEGILHAQNGEYVRKDRMNRMPPERRKPVKKVDPRQKGFGFE